MNMQTTFKTLVWNFPHFFFDGFPWWHLPSSYLWLSFTKVWNGFDFDPKSSTKWPQRWPPNKFVKKTGDLSSMGKKKGRMICLFAAVLRVIVIICECVAAVRVAGWPMPSDLYCLHQWEAQLHCLHCSRPMFPLCPPPPLQHQAAHTRHRSRPLSSLLPDASTPHPMQVFTILRKKLTDQFWMSKMVMAAYRQASVQNQQSRTFNWCSNSVYFSRPNTQMESTEQY